MAVMRKNFVDGQGLMMASAIAIKMAAIEPRIQCSYFVIFGLLFGLVSLFLNVFVLLLIIIILKPKEK